VSERRAGLEKGNAEADPPGLRGKPLTLDETATASNGCAGVVASACMEEKIVGTREAPAVAARDRQPDSGDGLAWAAWGDGEARSSDEAG
jgi:hypothetical protein